jgi:hypothetical protein
VDVPLILLGYEKIPEEENGVEPKTLLFLFVTLDPPPTLPSAIDHDLKWKHKSPFFK